MKILLLEEYFFFCGESKFVTSISVANKMSAILS